MQLAGLHTCSSRRAVLPGAALLLLSLWSSSSGAQGFTPGVRVDLPTGINPVAAQVADLNGDGHPDIVVANDGSSTVSVLLGNGAGVFATHVDFATGANPASVAVGDLNGDGKPDIVTANSSGNSISVLLGNGAGSFGAKTDFPPRRIPSAW